MKKIFFLITLVLSQLCFAQKGNIAGTVYDEELNDVLPFASVIVKGSSAGASTDFDGKYNLDIDPGTYTLVFSFVGYTNVEVSDVVVASGKETIVDAYIKEAGNVLEEVVITTSRRKNTEKAITILQRNSATVVDGLSVQGIKKSGASNVAAAIKQVPGVSIQGGKFVVVRGLSDRYSKTTLNGLDVPGLDPDKNSLQVDLFPTNILENLVVNKTASADLPADFTGGIVDITLKDFSTKPEYTVSAGFGFNPNQHFKSEFQNIDKGSTGFLGFNSERDVPIDRNLLTPVPLDTDRINQSRDLTLLFDRELRAQNETNFGNINFGLTASNHYKLKNENKLGYQANLSYRSQTSFFENAIDGTYLVGVGEEMFARNLGTGQISSHQTLLTGLAGLSFKTEKAKFKLTGLYIRNGLSNASIREQELFENGDLDFRRIVDENTYTEKEIANFLLAGEYKFNDWSIDWKLSPTISKVHDLDHRSTPFRINENTNSENTLVIDAASGTPFRIWRFLDEENITSKLDFSKKYELPNAWKGKFKFGGYTTLKDREFSLGQYSFSGGPIFTGEANPNDLFLPENIISTSDVSGFQINGSQNFRDTEAFEASQNTLACFVMNETKFSDKLRASFGVRLENFETIYSGYNPLTFEFLVDEELINTLDIFPSVNIVYSLSEKTNVRASYSKSTARPSFREASTNDIYDPVTDRRFIGALGFGVVLRPTYIDNFDLRYEFFGENGDGFALSGFYKNFVDAIELVSPVTAFTVTPRNLENAFLFGGELEIRKNLGFIGLERFATKFNASYVYSEVENTISITGEDNDTRNLQGQAPFNINAVIEYKDEKDFVANLNYNVQGETLEIVGSGSAPNVFTQPFHRLVLNTSKSYGKHKVSFKITNLLDDVRESFYIHNGDSGIFTRRVENRTFSLGYTYKF